MRALLVGVDNYRGNGDLDGCVNDVTALDGVLSDNWDGSPNFHTIPLIGQIRSGRGVSEVTRAALRNALKKLFEPDDATGYRLFYFAGHGVRTGDGDFDLWLRTSDGDEDSPGVRFAEISRLIHQLSQADGEVLVILDCCFSGAAAATPPAGSSSFTRPGVSIITSTRDDEEAPETVDGRGFFSTHLEVALAGGASDVVGRVTVAGLYAYLTEVFGTFGQRPTLKADVQRLRLIRQCEPAVPLPVLRKLPTWFREPFDEYPLDPSYEPSEEPRNHEHEAIFRQLQACVAAHLVVPVRAPFMYYAALDSTACALTPLGRRYRQLAALRLI